MLTRLFSHSKPIAFAILSILFAIAFVVENFISTTTGFSASIIFSKLGVLAVFLLIVFLLNFMVKRNKIHQHHTFAASSFVLLIIAFPEILRSTEFVFSYFFLLLSFRRILSLKTNTNFKQKLFDSSFLLSISIWFEPFHWLFIAVIYFGVIMYASQNYRHFIIPVVGLAVGFVLRLCYFLIFENKWIGFQDYLPEFTGIDFFFDSFKYGSLLGLLLLILVWIIFQLPVIFNRAKLHQSESLSIVLFFMLISIAVMIFNNSPLAMDAIYLVWPLSILIGNYFQLKSTKKWIKEVFYMIFLAGIVFSALY
ncbi:DUF6427 family protein [Psychroflexus sediminis]|uniref:Uncharacterized protein n=1 Tax=Psychroflexus sediminis TaxID=470826 RepID=A0A1G7X7E3_9FLAO|nr:DUF6427 family protein [Psychroflexus sediminis]SDG80084.1 hypothetical protein SAMN04488027_107137 [Psychroflexus sediminis]